MGIRRIAAARAFWLFALSFAVAVTVVFVAGCSTTPTEEREATVADSKAADVSAERPVPVPPANQVEPSKPGEPINQVEAAKPITAVNGCVACHTSKENVKKTAAPPVAAAKSAEQAGEG